MPAPRALRLALCACVGAAAAASCFVSGYELLDTGGSGGAAANGAGGAGGGCRHATWPLPPDTTDNGVDVDVVFAVRQVDFGETSLQDGPGIGYDQDNRCTCEGEGPSCLEPAWANANHCDGPEGRDNAASQLFQSLGIVTDAFSSATQTAQAEAGNWSLLVRVRHYNGQPNDQQVEVSLYPSPGRDNDPCLASQVTPAWNGADEWPISAESLVGSGGAPPDAGSGEGGCQPDAGSTLDPDAPRYDDTSAYVHGGVLVANLPQAGLLIASASHATLVKITAGFLTAQIAYDPASNRWTLRNGLLVGRWKTTDFLAMLDTFDANGTPLCTTNMIYPIAKAAICSYADLASSLGGPTTPCDAISFGMAFEADQARLGHILQGASAASLCPPESDPAFDTCGGNGG